MLAANTSSHSKTLFQNCCAEIFHPLFGFGLRSGIQDQRMQIAITRMEHIGHRQTMLMAESFDRRQNQRKAASGDDTVLHVVGGGDFSHCRERGFAPFPKHRTFGWIFGSTQSAGTSPTAQLLSPCSGSLDLRFLAIKFN